MRALVGTVFFISCAYEGSISKELGLFMLHHFRFLIGTHCPIYSISNLSNAITPSGTGV